MTLGPVFSTEEGQFHKVPEADASGALKKVRDWKEVAGPFETKAEAADAYKRAVRELREGNS